MKALQDEQPQHDGDRVETIFATHSSLFPCFIEKLWREKLQEARSKPGKVDVRKRVEGELRVLVFASSYLNSE